MITLPQSLPATGQRSAVLSGLVVAGIGLHCLFGIKLCETFLDLLDPLGEEFARGFRILGIGTHGHLAVSAQATALKTLPQARAATLAITFAATKTTAEAATKTTAAQAAAALTAQTPQATAAGATLTATKTTAAQAAAALTAQAPQTAAAGATLTPAQTATQATTALAAQAATQTAATLAQTAAEAAAKTCSGTGATGSGPGSAARTATLTALCAQTFERALIFVVVGVVISHLIRSVEIHSRGPGTIVPVPS